jgi:hypothetical protein
MTGATRRELRLVTKRRRRLSLFLTRKALLFSGVALAALSFGLTTASASASAPGFSFQASAWGSQVRVGNVLKSGRSALTILGCTSAIGVTHSNTAAGVHIPKALSTGTINTTAASETTKTGVAATSSAATEHVSLLGGVVKATAIKSVSTTSHNTSTGAFKTSAAGTHFVKLVIGGKAIAGTPPANTKITLPGIGFVVLNKQTSHIGGRSAGMSVIAIHLVVTVGSKNAKLGTQVNVSVAHSALIGPVEGVLNGLAFGSSARIGGTVRAGRSFPQYMPCHGTGGKTRKNMGVRANIPGVLKSGTITDTANGTVSSTQVSGETSSTIQQVSLLSGVITASVVKADVTANGKPPTLGDNSSFIGLHVVGHPAISDNVPVNTKLGLPGIGTLWLHKQVKTANGIKVIMIQLVIGSKNNPAGLPQGAKVNVGYAHVGVS